MPIASLYFSDSSLLLSRAHDYYFSDFMPAPAFYLALELFSMKWPQRAIISVAVTYTTLASRPASVRHFS